MTDDAAVQAQLLHQLRNHLNLIGLALHAYRRDGQPRHLEVVEDTCSAAGELFERFGGRCTETQAGQSDPSG